MSTGYYLECTTAGTSGSSDITPASTIGSTVTDDTVVWTVRGTSQFLLCNMPLVQDNYNNYTKPGIYKVDGSAINKSPANYGIMMVLKNDYYISQITIDIVNHVFVRSLRGANWENWHQLEGVAEKLSGTNSYIRYASGLIVQWGRTTITDPSFIQGIYLKMIFFPISFSNTQYSIVLTRNSIDKIAGVQPMYKNAFNITCESDMTDSQYYWFAIGY